MKNNRFLRLGIILLILCMVCAGCAKAVSRFEDEAMRQDTDTVLAALLADNVQAAYAPFRQYTTLSEFTPIFNQMRDFLGDADTYELKLLSMHTDVRYNGGEKLSRKSAVYEMRMGDRLVIVSVSSQADTGLIAFRLTPYENTDYYATGTLDALQDINAAQIIVLLSNIIPIGLTVWAIVDCIRQKTRKKALWILAFLFGFISLSATLSETRLMFNFNLAGLAGYSALVRYGSGSVMLRGLVPVGAIVYFIQRLRNRKAAGMIPEEPVIVDADPVPTEEPAELEQPPVEKQE
jgi:heme A synthase